MEFGDNYYFIGIDGKVARTELTEHQLDIMRARLGNCYKTKKEAEADVDFWKNFYSGVDKIDWTYIS